jgi:drug/metabolite transporter (DMT)-like permease
MSNKLNIKDETLGMWLGVIGVALFAVTLPMTRLATGTQAEPQLSPWFVTLGRAALAGVLSAIFLLVTRSPRPAPHQWKPLGIAVLGNCIGFPLLLAYALRVVTASHAAVVTALLPLATAAVAAWVLHQRARLGFWLCATAGSVLVVLFSLLRARQNGHGFGFMGRPAAGRRGARGFVRLHLRRAGHAALGAEHVICWVCVMALPVTLPGPLAPVAAGTGRVAAWAGFVYVGVFSMWIGFFAWYRGLAIGRCTAREPGAAAAALPVDTRAVPLLGEPLDAVTLGFASPWSPRWSSARMPAATTARACRARSASRTPLKSTSQPHPPERKPMNWKLAARAAKMNPSVIREILKVTERPGIISWPAACRRPRPSRSPPSPPPAPTC